MTNRFRITLAQLDPTLGDLSGNAAKTRAAWEAGKAAGADLVALPELFITGYQPQDLIMRPAFHSQAIEEVEALAVACADGPMLAIGAPWVEGGKLHNAYHICRGGRVISRTLKHFLPNYNVFDEKRLFEPGPLQGPFDAGPLRIGTPICEDAWYEDVCEAMAESGTEVLLVPNGSPYRRGKFDVRMASMVPRVIETGLPLVYLNLVGGQDDQAFDGGSFVLNPGGELALQMPRFEEAIVHVDFVQTEDGWRAEPGEKVSHPSDVELDYRAMVMTLSDYMRKTGFSKVLLGLSGGIDSAIVATIAADALGPENVRCVMLPSEYTSQASLDDAAGVARALGCRLDEVSIAGPRRAVTEALAPLFEGLEEGLTEENIQSRLRGLLLMAQSNKFGEMLLTTGNKSEVAVGYATIYGDMAGGYNPIKDLYKTRVFDACRWRNANHRPWMKAPAGEVIPQSIIDKPPSAELRPDQKDSDSLPPYDVLDGILEMLVEGRASVADCVAAGFDVDTVRRVEKLIFISEYKRFQSAPGTRLTTGAFWLDRRYPIVNRWRDRSGPE
ncbi:NAD+ synthase [Ponticoccus sp. SC2-23]|uniref:NAD+ synthase n=1 Tax=Alexandriicola marinus TaxID=2081710 RepID=UPI000FDB52B8|nr:NAD+ synthase [Alexandriicola marinus]MBM1221234.1 NAD+ synthase [Ponticoccus sp. SC6-9]MBM1225804.1 NAD+ synthase [Ponticoccus sp. SC6-15]MBM1227956.1 NAD+ synthase [Ponticoccus sp. SC6-38]MBM1234406.1 NAD+ synthase [Ponticoccus sp. SC6-45]MBM1238458.1 NAD+ synthase [Ponticoccus sp. SC6-49]MBM1243727.1 NAD+ synthase [Ponticoccus sp. SC2-64]MBM1247930.1 NAD+ synthase [Ponticoccus sp. SC6-42]MBM1252858.1 NAD+ synthase [Ponticoccus sp. SC6-33]MBM1256467.1 NAD+ synthase [Ponticoccus sp. SC